MKTDNDDDETDKTDIIINYKETKELKKTMDLMTLMNGTLMRLDRKFCPGVPCLMEFLARLTKPSVSI